MASSDVNGGGLDISHISGMFQWRPTYDLKGDVAWIIEDINAGWQFTSGSPGAASGCEANLA